MIFENEEFSSLLFETGYRKPLITLQVDDKGELASTLRQYYTILRGQVELDQFIEGLNTYNLLSMVRQHPDQFKRMFVQDEGVQLSKGVHVLGHNFW